ncbi:type II secretion system F family protein [Nocardioides caeni]|uniref:Type II secretion system protein n=1 Tax=Nocardioides caeni TaxID=574700 RepID=A0A4S8N042_9ACTN|nr:type II secretion system F family protein [Nocardioides caeni]THV09128.1 type II secretion system protein [Nocardioides caeni]
MTGMTGMTVIAALVVAALALLRTPRPSLPASTRPATPVAGSDTGDLLRRGAWAWAMLAGAGTWAFVGGTAGPPAAVIVAIVVAGAARRLEPVGERRRREAARRELPHVVSLLGSALRSGLAAPDAVELVVRALAGPAADRLLPWTARLRLGEDPAAVWSGLAADPALGTLGRALLRAHRSGAPVADAVDALAAELAEHARGEVEDRARSVGVRAAVPLGVCLLPAFVLLGIVPLVVGLATSVV